MSLSKLAKREDVLLPKGKNIKLHLRIYKYEHSIQEFLRGVILR